jgi:hypothetical protein
VDGKAFTEHPAGFDAFLDSLSDDQCSTKEGCPNVPVDEIDDTAVECLLMEPQSTQITPDEGEHYLFTTLHLSCRK